MELKDMKKIFFGLLSFALTIVLALYLGTLLGKYLVRSKIPEPRAYDVTRTLTDYNLAIDNIYGAKLLSKDRTSDEKKALKKNVRKSHEALDKALKIAINKYGESLKLPINNFIEWDKQISINKITAKENYSAWRKQFNKKAQPIINELRKVTGIYNIDNPKYARVMLSLPDAKINLQNHPNNPKLCTIMRKYPTNSDEKIIAKQIAFIDLGEKYCNNYYHERSNWGNIAYTDTPKEDSKIIYDKLTYNDYYQQYILPEIPNALEKLRNKSQNSSWCAFQGLTQNKTREPKADAMRFAYRSEGNKDCPSDELPNERDYMNTNYACIDVKSWFCRLAKGRPCDILERCKPANDILFKD